MFDFDAIQVMEYEELQHLPEAVNREIVKNSEEIFFEEEEEVSERNLIKLNDIKNKFLSYNQEIFLEEKEEEVLRQKAVEKDRINKENKEDNGESIEGDKEDVSMQVLIKMNKNKDKILKDNQKVSFKKKKKDFSEKYMLRLKEETTDILKNSHEVMYGDKKDDFLKRNITWVNEKDADNMKNCQEVIFKQEEGVLEKKFAKLDEGNDDIMKNHRIHEKEQLAFIKVKENPKDIRHLIKQTLYKPKEEYKTRSNEFAKKDYEVCLEKRQRLHNKKLIILLNRDQKNIEKNTENIFTGKKRKCQKRFDRSLSEDLLTTSDKRSFKESLRNRNNKLILSINQDNKNSENDPFSSEKHSSSKKPHRSFADYFVKTDDRRSKENTIGNIRISKKDQKSLQQISKYSAASLDHLNSDSVFDQQLNFNSLRWENDDSHYQMKQHDNIRIENERTQRKSSSHRPVKIAIQDRLYSNGICSMDSPIYDLSPESGFCEQSCRELFTRNMKDTENIKSVESYLSRENTTDNPKEYIKSRSVEAITSINNSIRNNEIASLPPSSKNVLDDENNLARYADASLIKEQIICMGDREQNIHEAKKKYKCPSTLSRKLISNFDESEKSSSIVEKQLVRNNQCIQNIEELTTQKSSFLNDASYKHFVRDNIRPEWFDGIITVEKQIDHNIIRNKQKRSRDFSNSNVSCENVVNDIVVRDYLKQYNNGALTEEQIYSNNKVQDRKQIYNSSNNNTSYQNFVSLDSRQCDDDDDFIPENQVVYESKINDNDMTCAKNTTDCIV